MMVCLIGAIDINEWLKVSHPTLAHKLFALLSGDVHENERKKYNKKTVYSIEKARELLGYSPRSFTDGMEDTTAWLIYYEYIPRQT